MSNLIYSTLPALRDRDIRLMSILPRQAQDGYDQVFCKLEIANLDRGTKYHALSYTWGSPWGAEQEHEKHQPGVDVRESRITCNGYSLSVRHNLKTAMIRIRDNPDWFERRIWVDAVCIDQETPGEQSSQVRLMADIFSSAETVMAWLGEEDKYTAKGFELIEKLAAHPDEIIQQITPRNFANQESLLGRCAGQEYWDALAMTFQRTYFTRVWIIQEIVLAKRVDVFCGRHLSLFPGPINADRLSTLATLNHTLPTKLRAITRDRGTGNYSRTFLYALIRSRVFKASDPRDKVYGLLGLVNEAAKDKPSLRPEYGNRLMSETYLLVAKQLLEDGDDLLILACAEGQRGELHAQTLLPSWVPDWSYEKALGLGITGNTRFSAAGGLPKYARVLEPSMTLELLGHKIDIISTRGACKSSVLGKASLSGWISIVESLPTIYHTGEDRLEVFWRTLVTNTGGSPPRYPIDKEFGYAFISWILIILASKYDNGHHNSELESQSRQLKNLSNSDQIQALFSMQSDHPSSQYGVNLESGAHTDPTADDYGATFSHTLHLCLFRTTKGYLGLGSEALVEGDSIWVIRGSTVPLILRGTSEGNYRLVGGVYLHGLMNRESSDFNNVKFNKVFVI